MQLVDLITPNAVKSYARAVIAVARACDQLRDQGYGVMVVPSRGAVPIVNSASAYRKSILNPLVARDDRIKLLKRSFSDPLTAAVHLPFTADMGEIGVPELDTAQIRAFWVRVVAAIARGDKTSPYYRFYRFQRDVVCRVGHHDNLEHCLNSERFIFIDTVVSGRAVVEIAEAFDAEGLTQIHYLLLVDENGDRIDPRYADRLYRLERQGRATLIHLDSLFTEDQGPAVSGVWSVVMPRLMEIARESVPEFSDGIVGAGLYYHEVRARDDGSNSDFTMAIGKLHVLLHQAMHVVMDLDQIAEDLERQGLFFEKTESIDQVTMIAEVMSKTFDWNVAEYLQHLDETALFDSPATQRAAEGRVLGGIEAAASLDVSGSHCLRLNFSTDAAASFIRQFKNPEK